MMKLFGNISIKRTFTSSYCFLIRGKQHGDLMSDLVRCKIYDYDQEWIDADKMNQ